MLARARARCAQACRFRGRAFEVATPASSDRFEPRRIVERRLRSLAAGSGTHPAYAGRVSARRPRGAALTRHDSREVRRHSHARTAARRPAASFRARLGRPAGAPHGHHHARLRHRRRLADRTRDRLRRGLPIDLGTMGGVVVAGMVVSTVRSSRPGFGGPMPEPARAFLESRPAVRRSPSRATRLEHFLEARWRDIYASGPRA